MLTTNRHFACIYLRGCPDTFSTYEITSRNLCVALPPFYETHTISQLENEEHSRQPLNRINKYCNRKLVQLLYNLDSKLGAYFQKWVSVVGLHIRNTLCMGWVGLTFGRGITLQSLVSKGYSLKWHKILSIVFSHLAMLL